MMNIARKAARAGMTVLIAGIAVLVGCTNGAQTSTPTTKITPTPAPLLIVGDGLGTLWAYAVSESGVPTASSSITVPNQFGLAAGGGIVATIGDGTINVIFPPSFSNPSHLTGFRIPSKPSAADQIAVDSSANLFVTNGTGYAVFKGVVGTTQPFATVKLFQTNGGTGQIAVAPNGVVDVQVERALGPGSYADFVYEFTSPANGSKQLNILSLSIFGLPMTFDSASRLFVSDGSSIAVFPQDKSSPITVFPVAKGPPAIAVDANDVVYVLANMPSNFTVGSIVAYRFNGSAFSRQWSIAAPSHASWLAVLQ